MRKENNFDKIEEVIDFVSNRLSDDAGMLAMGSSTTPADPIPFSQDQLTSCTSKPLATGCAHDPPKSNNLSNQSEEKLLSDLIVNCVAAFMMIQVIKYMLHYFAVVNLLPWLFLFVTFCMLVFSTCFMTSLLLSSHYLFQWSFCPSLLC